MNKFLAVDIGGTSAKCAMVSSDGELRRLRGFPTGKAMRLSSLKEQLEILIRPVAAEIDGIGISTLGIIDPRLQCACSGVENLPCLLNFAPAEFIAETFPNIKKVSVMNDARSAALGEHWMGAGKGCADVLCVAFGTGIGSCAIIGNQLIRGHHNQAGEIGYWHNAGREEPWENYGSAQAMIYSAQRELNEPVYDGIRFFDDLRNGNSVCRRIFDEWAEQTAAVLADIVMILDLEKIVVGGGISAVGNILTDSIQEKMEKYLPEAFRGLCKVVPAELGNDAALLGAVKPLL